MSTQQRKAPTTAGPESRMSAIKTGWWDKGRRAKVWRDSQARCQEIEEQGREEDGTEAAADKHGRANSVTPDLYRICRSAFPWFLQARCTARGSPATEESLRGRRTNACCAQAFAS
ncbi:hypothetical protein J3458_003415 [Metarhizium acridum]|uniref:uncharacterized protein n=1 Tax=Metarhizium acridum TaxID=92637 RepID=UPI001C6AD461|nr:hypothetical protein J3458_003415 [Metarhizium acridum]